MLGGKYSMEHHSLDPYPIPKEKTPLFVNEPWLLDRSRFEYAYGIKGPQDRNDNIRVYVPLDLNKEIILQRLDMLIMRYGEANEKNESDFSIDVDMLISQVEIYDQIWYVRHMPEYGEHSREAINLVKEFVRRLEEIPDGCAELFPFDTIERLKEEYLSEIE